MAQNLLNLSCTLCINFHNIFDDGSFLSLNNENISLLFIESKFCNCSSIKNGGVVYAISRDIFLRNCCFDRCKTGERGGCTYLRSLLISISMISSENSYSGVHGSFYLYSGKTSVLNFNESNSGGYYCPGTYLVSCLPDSILKYIGMHKPSGKAAIGWSGNPQFSYIKKIVITDCEECEGILFLYLTNERLEDLYLWKTTQSLACTEHDSEFSLVIKNLYTNIDISYNSKKVTIQNEHNFDKIPIAGVTFWKMIECKTNKTLKFQFPKAVILLTAVIDERYQKKRGEYV